MPKTILDNFSQGSIIVIVGSTSGITKKKAGEAFEFCKGMYF